jgi:hypothetical protein
MALTIGTQLGFHEIMALLGKGGMGEVLTSFATDQIFSFAWSKDGKRLLLSRGTLIADVVLVTQVLSTAASQK